MTSDDLTPTEREAVQEHLLRRHMARVYPQGVRRRSDREWRREQRIRNPRWGFKPADGQEPAPGYEPTPYELAVRL